MFDGNELLIGTLMLLAAALYASVGHAGASGYLAVMALFGVAAPLMKPTSLCLNILVATISTLKFRKHFQKKLFLVFALPSIPMAVLGGMTELKPQYIQIGIGMFLLFSAYRMISGKVQTSEERVSPSPLLAILLSAIIGYISGLIGVGGGIFLSPILLLMGWADPKQTAGISSAFILVNSISGLIGAVLNQVSLHPATPLWAIGVLCGGYLGAHFGSQRFSNPVLNKILAIVLVVAALKLLI